MLWRFSFTILICIYLIDLFFNTKANQEITVLSQKMTSLVVLYLHGHILIDNYLRFIVLTQKELKSTLLLCY